MEPESTSLPTLPNNDTAVDAGEVIRADVHSSPDMPKTDAKIYASALAPAMTPSKDDGAPTVDSRHYLKRSRIRRYATIAGKAARFIGPGAMVSVSYIDPGNYATNISAGASLRFKLLCVVLLSNLLAVFLQSLALRLGTVTGRDLARLSRDKLPRWVNIIVYLFAEAAILATDIAEVIGVAIALNLLSQGRIPLVAGVAVTMTDVIIILAFYNRAAGNGLFTRGADGKPRTGLWKTQLFEVSVGLLVVAVAICFSIELSKLTNVSVGEVFRGYLPSKAMVESNGLYLSCGILGATVMPHSIYLGSGLVQTRLRDYDVRHGFWNLNGLSDSPSMTDSSPTLTALEIEKMSDQYRPSLAAIRNCLPYSLFELIFSLITFALFINSAILITAGATLSNTAGAADADLFSIYALLKAQLSPIAATIFAIALLFSGQTAGLVVTLAGQMVAEGHINIAITPWKRRLVTRGIAVIPPLVVAASVGREGLGTALTASQVALSIILPVVSAPLIWFTCQRSVMSVEDESLTPSTGMGEGRTTMADLSNSRLVCVIGAIVWLFITGLNLYLVISLAMGNT